MISDEHDIIKKIKTSDEDAFRVLYEEYSPRIFGFLCRKLNDREQAYDLVQEVFVRVWNNREKLDETKSIKSYLFTAANNAAIDFFRKKKLETVDIDDYENASVYRFEENFDIPDHIKAALNKLTPMQKNVFYMSRFEGLKHEEIAEVLKLSKRTVENHISRALGALRENLKYLLLIILTFLFEC